MSFIDDFSSGTSDLLGLVTDTSNSVGSAASSYAYADSAIDSVFGGSNPSQTVVQNAQQQAKTVASGGAVSASSTFGNAFSRLFGGSAPGVPGQASSFPIGLLLVAGVVVFVLLRK